ncbi:SPFH domain-containing protein [Hymenobacter baengnokdamensis]|uniref:SPFH domain-containing protein n=1 Tax=Hymenobacter baengnokdamensis TaxID=2615203 RepID=UPI0012454CEB|nr:SPFH domain-containing protein [Hymenobacter baengnokdamensis]
MLAVLTVPFFYTLLAILGGLLVLLLLARSLLGIVVIGELEVGIVAKKFANTSLAAGRLIALEGEAGLQADTLAPGWHFFLWPWQFAVTKEPVTVVPQGEIGLVVANGGSPIPPSHMLGRVVACDDYQDARAFLTSGGEKGRQLGILTAGTYRINTALFTIITRRNADSMGMNPNELAVYRVAPDAVGIVTTLDGIPIEPGEIAGPVIPEHDNFQDAQRFLIAGGRRGLQEQVLLSGAWNLNPWFCRVEQVPMTEIPIGHVGVVISFVGRPAQDVSGADFTHGNLVEVGHKGIWVTPLYPGRQPLNTRIMRVELVPTTNIVLNWAVRTEAHGYDNSLSSITVRSRDGFSFNLDVAQIIHVAALDAPRVISRVGSMQNLVDHVLEPIVGNYFRNSSQEYTVLDYLTNRAERQRDAATFIRNALAAYNVQAVDTLIGDIVPPAQLMTTQTDRKLAEEQRKTYEVQQAAQTQRQALVRETSIADIQSELVKSEQGVNIAELNANSQVKKVRGEAEAAKLRAGGEAESTRLRAIADSEATRLRGVGEAEAIRAIGQAKAEAYQVGVASLGTREFTALQLMQIIGDRQVKITPDVQANGSSGAGSGGLVEALVGLLVQNQKVGPTNQTGKPEAAAPETPVA